MSLPGAILRLENLLYEKKFGIKFALEVVNKGLGTSQTEGLSLEASFFGFCAVTEDKKEGMQAFLQKHACKLRYDLCGVGSLYSE